MLDISRDHYRSTEREISTLELAVTQPQTALINHVAALHWKYSKLVTAQSFSKVCHTSQYLPSEADRCETK